MACYGRVLNADYVSGPPDVFRLAAAIVKRWHYRKTFMNGQAVEIFTTVTIQIDSGQTESGPKQ